MARTKVSGKQGVPVKSSSFKRSSKKIISQDLHEKFANMHLTPPPQISETNGVAAPLVLPWELIEYIKDAVDVIKRMEANKDDKYGHLELETIEESIESIVTYRKATKDLPSDWKFDRATAIHLLD